MERTLVAIDPGAAGGIAYMDSAGRVNAVPMPTTEGDIAELLTELTAGGAEVYLEQVAPRPGQGIASTGKFMSHYGFLRGILAARRVRVVLTRPQTWMRALELGTKGNLSATEWKNRLKGAAQRLYPDLKVTLNTADSLLLLEYGRRQR